MLKIILFWVTLFWIHAEVFGADETILLEESQIFGKRPTGMENQTEDVPLDLPALSTAFPWEGEEADDFNIPEEVLNHLTQPDPSFLSDEGFELQEEERVKGD